MILPKNGRVIIIDDVHKQAMPLILALSKYNISSTYFDAKKENLPVEKIKDVRVVFLDLNLNSGQQLNWETEKSIIQQNIIAIISPNTPYLLFVWSVNEGVHFEDLKGLFENELREYKPIAPLIKMEKDQIFKQDIEGDSIEWNLANSIEETFSLIENKINEGLSKIDSLEVILAWENIVNESSSEITNEISLLTSGKANQNEELKYIYFKLAESMWGRQLNSNTNEIAEKAINVFNNLLIDKLEFKINKGLNLYLINNITPPKTFSDFDKAIFNTKLLLNFHDKEGVFPGNCYEILAEEINKPPYSGLIADSLLIPLVNQEFYNSLNASPAETDDQIKEFKDSHRKEYAQFEKSIRDAVKKEAKYVLIEVSPMCDFAQKKWKLSRVCPAILWNYNQKKYIAKSDNLYVSPLILLSDQYYHMVIDLRYFTSIPLDQYKTAIPLFNLKHSFLTDIQSYLSRHTNRPGITSLL